MAGFAFAAQSMTAEMSGMNTGALGKVYPPMVPLAKAPYPAK